MKLTEIAIKENRLTYALILFVVIGGLIAFFNLPRFEDPKIPFRYAFITTLYPGASVERMETLVTERIEEILSEIPEIEFINGESRKNASGIVVKIQDRYTQVKPVWDRIRRKLDRLKNTLPEGVQGPFFNDEYGEVFGTIIAVTGKDLTFPEIRRVTLALRKKLLRLEEVSKVITLGDQEEQIVVQYDDAEMAEIGLSPLHLKSFLEAQNVIAPGGSIRQGDTRVAVESRNDLNSVEAVEDLQVSLPEEEDIFALGELLDISREIRHPPMSILRSSGARGIGLAVSLRQGGNIEKLGRDVRRVVDDYMAEVSSDVEFQFVAFEPERVTYRVNQFFIDLLQSLVIVMVILMLALGLRTGSIVASMMPLVILATLAVMLGLKLNINLVALAAFIVVLGIMVDNHIVISERILTLREKGESSHRAAIAATSQLYAPLLTATATTIAGFLPIYLAESSSGEYVTPLFEVVTIALICSTFFAFTVTPLLSLRLFKIAPQSAASTFWKLLYRFYRNILLALMPRPLLALSVLFLLFLLSLYTFRFVPTIFFPPSDRPVFTLELEFPSGTVIEKTEEAASRIESYVMENLVSDSPSEARILNWVAFVGRNAPRFVLNHRTREYSPEYTYFLFNITSPKLIPFFRGKLEEFCHATFPQATVRIQPIEAGPAVGFPIIVHAAGDDIDGIFRIADEVANYMSGIPGLYNISNNWGRSVKKLHVVIDEDKAALAAVTRGEIALTLQTFLTGIPATDLRIGSNVIPVFVKSTVNGMNDVEEIKSLHVFSRLKETTVPLGEIAEIVEVFESANIIRRDFQRTVTVGADVREGTNYKEVDDQIEAFLSRNRSRWGNDYYVRLGGQGSESAKANKSILVNLPWAIFIILLLLIRQTRSIRRTFIIMCAVPMGVIGVVFGLLATRQPFGFTTLIGIVSLTGIVVNNAIILIDRIRLNENAAQFTRQECIIEAALNRLRPILLTTLTTVGGISPLYLRANPTWQGMAVAIIFGLSFATLLVLFMVPLLYAFLFRVPFKDYKP